MKYIIAIICIELAILVSILTLHTEIVVAGQISSVEGIIMPTTNYSELDSCHYRVKEGCLTASGTIASKSTIACPRHWKLGTKVLMEGKEYICEDRYNANLSDRIDIFVGYGKDNHIRAINYGVREITIVLK